MNKALAIAIIFLSATYGVCVADTKKKVEVTDTYYVPETQSLYDAKIEAVKAARIKALANTFGSLVSVATDISINNGQSFVKAKGLSEVRGEWLADIRPPHQQIWFDESLSAIIIKTTVCGYARPYASLDSDISCAITRNDDNFDAPEASEFTDGDNMFLTFRSVRSGHLAAFLIDDNGGVHTLLPYNRDKRNSTVTTERGLKYVFFSHNTAPILLANITNRYILRSSSVREHNRICIVFSPNDFTRSANENFTSGNKPHFQNYDDFDSWLFNVRSKDPSMAVIYKDIFINRPKQ